MDRTRKTDGPESTPNGKSEKKTRSKNTFTSDMHFIVTRNKRNIWQDEMYDSPPNTGDLPVFN